MPVRKVLGDGCRDSAPYEIGQAQRSSPRRTQIPSHRPQSNPPSQRDGSSVVPQSREKLTSNDPPKAKPLEASRKPVVTKKDPPEAKRSHKMVLRTSKK